MEAVAKGNDARTARAPQAQRIDGLDGLRALSIAIVLLGHAARGVDPPRWLWPLRDLGTLGVYLFFAISGFIITLLMLRERQRRGRVSLKAFWQRRALRILPPFAAACCGIALAAASGLIAWHWQSFLGALSFTKNTELFRGDWFFGHFWSLSMEEQFYLLWPLLFLLLMALNGAPSVLLAMALSAPLLALLNRLSYPLFNNILPCLPYLSLGCLLAVLLNERHRWLQWWRERRGLRAASLLVLPALAVACAVAQRNGERPYLSDPLAAGFGLLAAFTLLAETVLNDGLLCRPMSLAPLRWLGLISYSLYLWQQLFMGPPDAYLAHWQLSAWPQNMVAAIVCASLAYLLVEKPAAALKQRLDRRTRKKAGGLAPPAPRATATLTCASRSVRT
jgi:peptidoglycan/LPS O-acetylase OafA/YrhL